MTSPTDLAERLREIRERAKDATPGPWRADSWSRCRCDVNAYSDAAPGGRYLIASLDYADGPGDDADFIAHAREDIPWLLDRLSALESAASGAVTDDEIRIGVGLILGEVYLMGAVAGSSKEPTSDNGSEQAAKIHALYAPRLAKAEQRCKELEGAWAALRAWCIGELKSRDAEARTREEKRDKVGYMAHRAKWNVLEQVIGKIPRAPSSEPAPSDGDSPPGLTTPTFVESGAYVDPWDALTPEQRETYIERAVQASRGGITYDAAHGSRRRQERQGERMSVIYKCDGCNREIGASYMAHVFRPLKPHEWFERADADTGKEYHACSRSCIEKISSEKGMTGCVLPI